MNKLIIAGGSGNLGQHLIAHLGKSFKEIVVLSRSSHEEADASYRTVQWDGRNVGAWSEELEQADAVINLSGKSIQTRFTEENKKLLIDSRVQSTDAIGKAINACKNPPRIWINASGAAIYPATVNEAHDEHTQEMGKGFKAELSRAWEATAMKHKNPLTRQVIVRITPVLTEEDGFLPPLLTLSKFGLGGAQGSGRQMVSWIHHLDLCRALEFIMRHDEIQGVVNLSSPFPLSNKEMMRTIRKKVGMPMGLPAPEFAIKIGALLVGIEPSLILESSNVIPGKLIAHGFEFKYPHLHSALEDLI